MVNRNLGQWIEENQWWLEKLEYLKLSGLLVGLRKDNHVEMCLLEEHSILSPKISKF